MNAIAVSEIARHWEYIAPALRPPTNDQEYEEAVALLNELLDQGGADENHPLADLASLLGNIVSDYETRQQPIPQASGVDCLRFLMNQHGC